MERAAEATNLDPTQLAKIEARTINVTLVTIVRVADGFSVVPDAAVASKS